MKSAKSNNAPPPLPRRIRGRVIVSSLVALVILSVDLLNPEESPATPQGVTVTRGQFPAPAIAALIDREINRRLEKDGVKASALSDDAEFIRRAYLDLIGVIPPAERVREFLASRDAEKRARLVDALLASPQFGRHMAAIWEQLLLTRGSDNRKLPQQPLVEWLTRNFNENRPWDKVTSELLISSGTQDQNGAVTFFLFNDSPNKVTDTVSKVFLGVQLQCAQCHNHPFTSWKQDDYWATAAFFLKVKPSTNPKAAQKKGIPVSISETAVKGKGKKKGLPESARIVPPRFLQGERPRMNPNQPYRPIFTAWLTAPENPFFARATVNRMWFHFFGRGLVNPVDDMHDGNPASHPELLAALAEQFKQNDYDLKHLIRGICASQAYQRTSRPCPGNEEDVELFSHMAIKALAPEQLYDSLTAVVGDRGRGAGAFGVKKNVAKGKGQPRTPREQFITFFRTTEDPDPTEYGGGIPQALRLMNSPLTGVNNAKLLNESLEAGKTPEQIIEHLYLGTLARRPSADELQRLTAYVRRNARQPRVVYGDILWAILNSSEFTLNH
jgi:hypothetical protein